MIMAIYVFVLTNGSSALMQADVKFYILATQIQILSTVWNKIDGTVQLKEIELEIDLGVHIDHELTFSKHEERQVNKANRILGLIRRLYKYIAMEVMKKSYSPPWYDLT